MPPRALFRDSLSDSILQYRRWRTLVNVVMLLALVVFVSTTVHFVTSPTAMVMVVPPAASPRLAAPAQPAAAQFRSVVEPTMATTTTTIPAPSATTLPATTIAAGTSSADVARQAAVLEAFTHAWSNYRERAWGADEIRPVTGDRSNEWGGLAATMIDALDTLWLMGLKDDFRAARDWIKDNFKPAESNWDGSTFEITIRYIGGLLAAYEFSNDKLFLDKAEEVAVRLFPAFDTPSGLALTTVNLRSGRATNPSWNGAQCVLAEFGTLGLEWRALSKYTGNPIYREKVDRIAAVLERQTSGLLPTFFNPQTGQPSNAHVTYGARGDSYYEYLLKQWVQSGKRDVTSKRLYDLAIKDTLARLVKRTQLNNLAYLIEMDGTSPINKMDELACFFAGMLTLSGDDAMLPLAEDIAHTCWLMFNTTATGLAPEIINFPADRDIAPQAPHNLLRPETVESLFYLWRRTRNEKYRERAWRIFQSWNANARVAYGFSGIHDVTHMPPNHNNRQESFFFAETLKYLYLTFSPDDALSLDEFVFNTEAHPMRIWR
jgi:mannosyl-oligosaccharide alpha-1,2-mannosidase